ncbi:DEAD/DEAH box helicase [Candidatus Margulisiibacteriota bacterium]
MSFKNMGLMPELLSAVTAQGYTEATPIQAKAISKILEGCDVQAGAQTGTGKTAAFSLPILQLLSRRSRRNNNPRALILTPTRELAAQVLEFIENYGQCLDLRSIAVFGGVGINPQIQKLRRGVDILVATPGRLLDLARQGNLNLSYIEILVLDEADRMLDMGFIHDIKRILKLIPKKRQSLMFSATYTNDIKHLADGILNRPELIEVAARNTTAETVDQVVHPVSRARKRELLSKLILDGKWNQALVFTRTKHGANKLTKYLISDKISAVAIHSNKSQGARTRALSDFKNGEVCVLVATDIAARGLDINLLPHVVNFDLPDTSESYVHRIGRTGRAGANGRAISLVCPEEQKELYEIHKLLKFKIPVEMIEGFKETSVPNTQPQRRQHRNWRPRKPVAKFRRKTSY